MKIVQAQKTQGSNWKYIKDKVALNNPLVLVFANRVLLQEPDVLKDIREEFPYEHLVFGSTAGEIIDTYVLDNSVTVLAIEFENTSFIIKTDNIFNHDKNTVQLGKSLSAKMPAKGLKHLFILSEGSFVSGTSLINGLENGLDQNVPITGGLCGDDNKFEKTLASYKEDPKEGEIVLIGFYGESLEITFASYGGWMPFGPERTITKAEGNTVYEIDGQPAMELYEKYLGDKASEAQFTLMYPLNVTAPGKTEAVVRTILSIDNSNQAMIFADDVPQGSRVQLMMVSLDDIANGAYTAAKLAMEERTTPPELGLLVSCIGRKLVMDQRIEEEIEQVCETIGEQAAIAGFYSYGEIAPYSVNHSCELHNQTMTLTLISE